MIGFNANLNDEKEISLEKEDVVNQPSVDQLLVKYLKT